MTRTVLTKLGYRPGQVAWTYARPGTIASGEITSLFALPTDRPVGAADLIVGFVAGAAQLAPLLQEVMPHYRRGGRLWLCYPKRSSGVITDMSRDAGWDALAPYDLVGVAQVAIDETWSALRFRFRDEIPKLTRAGLRAPEKPLSGG